MKIDSPSMYVWIALRSSLLKISDGGRGGGRRRHSERERDRMATANGRVMREMEAWGVSANLRTNNDFDRKVRLNPHGGRLLKPTLIIIHRESLDHLTFFLSNSIQGLTLTGGRNSF